MVAGTACHIRATYDKWRVCYRPQFRHHFVVKRFVQATHRNLLLQEHR